MEITPSSHTWNQDVCLLLNVDVRTSESSMLGRKEDESSLIPMTLMQTPATCMPWVTTCKEAMPCMAVTSTRETHAQ